MIKKLIVTTIILFLAVMLVVALHAINKHDLSVQKAATCNFKEKGPIYLITYGEGDVYIANTKVLAESALNNCVDVVYMYRKEHLDEAFVEKNKKILSAKRGAGYWLWKPYLVLKTLEQMPENATLLYVDSGLKIIKPLDGLINNIGDDDMVLMTLEDHHKNVIWTKHNLFKMMDMDNDAVKNSAQISGTPMIIKNNQRNRNFVKQWLEVAQIDGAINDDISEDEDPAFKAHRHDQSILSLLYYKDPSQIKLITVEEVLDYFYWHRRNSAAESLFLLDYVAKDWPSMRSYVMQLPMLDKILYGLLRLQRKLNDF